MNREIHVRFKEGLGWNSPAYSPVECLHVAHAPKEVLAVARLANEPSVRLFLSMGFIRESDDGELVRLILPHGRVGLIKTDRGE